VTDGWRWSTDSGVEGDDGQTERTEQTMKDWRRTDEDSRQRTVDADGRSTAEEHKDDNPVTKNFIFTAAHGAIQ